MINYKSLIAYLGQSRSPWITTIVDPATKKFITSIGTPSPNFGAATIFHRIVSTHANGHTTIYRDQSVEAQYHLDSPMIYNPAFDCLVLMDKGQNVNAIAARILKLLKDGTIDKAFGGRAQADVKLHEL